MNASALSPEFCPTRWSLIVQAGEASTLTSRRALEELCRLYWPPLYCFARRRGLGTEDAQDVTQAFFAELLAGRLFDRADPDKGRLRTFLLTAFTRALTDRLRHDRAQKRGGGAAAISIDAQQAEGLWAAEPADHTTPEQAFDRKWALTVLETAMKRLETECAASRDAALFAAAAPALTGELEPGRLEAIAAGLGKSCGAFRNDLTRLRKRCRELVRAEIAETLHAATDAAVDDELAHLLAALRSGSG